MYYSVLVLPTIYNTAVFVMWYIYIAYKHLYKLLLDIDIRFISCVLTSTAVIRDSLLARKCRGYVASGTPVARARARARDPCEAQLH